MRKLFLFMMVFLFASCGHVEVKTEEAMKEATEEYAYETEEIAVIEEIEKFEEAEEFEYDPIEIEIIEFITLPSGAVVDTRLSETEIDLVLRHFAAIEEGDADAFWATLGGGQDGVDFNHWRGIAARYFPDWMMENDGNLDDFSWLDETTVLDLRGTGLFVREIDLLDIGVMRAMVTNDHGDKRTFIMPGGDDGCWEYADGDWIPRAAIGGHSPWMGFSVASMHQVLIADFIWRNYPSIFMGYGEQAAASQSFLDNGNLDSLPPGFILLDEPVLPYAPRHFRAHQVEGTNLTITISFRVPNAEARFAATRVYRFDALDNVFHLVHETIGHVDFFEDNRNRRAIIIIAESEPGNAAPMTSFTYGLLFWSTNEHPDRVMWNSFVSEPMRHDVPFNEAQEIFTGLTPLECIINQETLRIIETRSLHALSILNKED